MAGTKEIKQRIKSVKNTKKITKAMELVAASKMKRAVSHAVASRLYSGYSWEMLKSISESTNQIKSVFFANGPDEDADSKVIGKNLVVLITSNSGLCGAYNAQAIKTATVLLKHLTESEGGDSVEMITIGKKGDGSMRRLGINIVASFIDMPDNSTLSDITPLSRLIIGDYKSNKYKSVYVVYTDFVSALTQKANVRKILPISKEELKDFIDEASDTLKNENKITQTEYLFEGDMNALIESLAEKITRMQIYQTILESSASEQSSRMLA
ncbi:MAG: ATP synthase F1 subunit gamma, partial [bacterium]